ncbi:hypothetical protein SAMN05428954_2889 [Streptomyces sp. 2112.3]|uniref:hypothetical protein n=1 Tax=Streptomyces sp. 2112.3 TaxID=1881023 RepID=UPI00089D7174|nr:hypothetical protein [Streptomyces sp. 2112.3]SEE53001.1 hypothetical protein SAMN05428954_2889 [Streptomyces sp. 2112.3]
MTYRAEATARYPGGRSIDLGCWTSHSPGRALGWVRMRAGHVAQQLGAPYDGVVHAWLEDAVGYRWARDGLVAGIPFMFREVDADGCTYTFVARPDAHARTSASLQTSCAQARTEASPQVPRVREAA